MAELFLGQIPEAIYFALFMIYAKNLKEKRLLFILLMVAEYILLKQFLHFTIWFQVLYIAITYIILKLLYKEKAQITDIFTFCIASIYLMIVSVLYVFLIYPFVSNPVLHVIINRIILIGSIVLLNKRLYKIQGLYKKFWNRNDKITKKIKTTTFRSINLIVFNVMFYVINVGLIYCILNRKWGDKNGRISLGFLVFLIRHRRWRIRK